uniref:Pro-resilin n=1 Tax=Panagrellus redivivus TaxID=6233 RepID=A0A7E4V484_PANRE
MSYSPPRRRSNSPGYRGPGGPSAGGGYGPASINRGGSPLGHGATAPPPPPYGFGDGRRSPVGSYNRSPRRNSRSPPRYGQRQSPSPPRYGRRGSRSPPRYGPSGGPSPPIGQGVSVHNYGGRGSPPRPYRDGSPPYRSGYEGPSSGYNQGYGSGIGSGCDGRHPPGPDPRGPSGPYDSYRNPGPGGNGPSDVYDNYRNPGAYPRPGGNGGCNDSRCRGSPPRRP